jgi:hypothetical protein
MAQNLLSDPLLNADPNPRLGANNGSASFAWPSGRWTAVQREQGKAAFAILSFSVE